MLKLNRTRKKQRQWPCVSYKCRRLTYSFLPIRHLLTGCASFKNAFSNTALTLSLINSTCFLAWRVLLSLKASAEPPNPGCSCALSNSVTDSDFSSGLRAPCPVLVPRSFLVFSIYYLDQLHNKHVYTPLFLPPGWHPLEDRNNCKLRTQWLTEHFICIQVKEQTVCIKPQCMVSLKNCPLQPKCQWILPMCGFWALAICYHDAPRVWEAQCVAIYLRYTFTTLTEKKKILFW